MTTPPTVLVSGARGYLGGRLCAFLRAQGGWRVRAGTRDGCGPVDADERVPVDLETDVGALRDACAGVSHVVNLASLNEIDSAGDPERAVHVTGLGARRLLAAAHAAGVARFVHVSTAHVYGRLVGAISEDSVPRPFHPYAIAHRVAEDFCRAARREGLDARVVRLSNAVGAPSREGIERWTLVANDLCRQAVTSGRVELRSNGRQWRDFVPMYDVLRVLEHLLSIDLASGAGRTFNFGGRRSLRVVDLAERITERAAVVLGHRPALVTGGGDEAPGDALQLSTDRIAATGFEWSGDLDAEIDETLATCRRFFARERTS